MYDICSDGNGLAISKEHEELRKERCLSKHEVGENSVADHLQYCIEFFQSVGSRSKYPYVAPSVTELSERPHIDVTFCLLCLPKRCLDVELGQIPPPQCNSSQYDEHTYGRVHTGVGAKIDLDGFFVPVRRDAILQTDLIIVFYLELESSVTDDDVGAGWYVSDGQNADCALESFLLGFVRIFDCIRRYAFYFVEKEGIAAKIVYNLGVNCRRF